MSDKYPDSVQYEWTPEREALYIKKYQRLVWAKSGRVRVVNKNDPFTFRILNFSHNPTMKYIGEDEEITREGTTATEIFIKYEKSDEINKVES